MNKDLIYIFDKLTFKRELLGEIQSDFNMSLTIDGTKDSTKMVVWSFSESEIEPNTICWHEKTRTWWIVSHDKIERYLNENESFAYIHSLQLEGAIELLNARDLTDCGFNQNTYTKRQFINRLFNLSSFEFKGDNLVINAPTNFLDQKVDFVKTYENYSLLSAIRDFLDSYNMCGKLEFGTSVIGGYYHITRATLNVIPKTGDNRVPTHNMSDFDDVRETKTMDKNSFGTTVVSNAENVISSVAKTYPSAGAVLPSGTEYIITPANAVLRLPSKVFKANWLKLATTQAPLHIKVTYGGSVVVDNDEVLCNPYSDASIEKAFATIKDIVLSHTTQTFYDEFVRQLEQNKTNIIDNLKKSSTITLYNGNQLNPTNGKIIKGDGVPCLVNVDFHSRYAGTKPYIFCDKETRETLETKYQGIQWERGSNLISGFDGFTAVTGSQQTIYVELKHTDLQVETYQYVYFHYEQDSSNEVFLQTIYNPTGATMRIHFGPSSTEGECQFIVNYIPMSDIKVKVDNQRTKKDMHLYNQNGKLTDNFALSKMINSYSKEISSDTITRYKWYYSYNDIPKVGSMVSNNGTTYVVNNVSMDFTQNENTNNDFGYIIECEITMSKYVSTKSLMVNPNTNIRDYGIPQNFNVKRKQLYRDYYELGYSLNRDNESVYYIDPQRMFNLGRTSNNNLNLIGVIRCDYKEPIGGNEEQEIEAQSTWYYQLETTLYYMNKMVYIMLDFNDNNIIGYASQNVYSGFKPERVFHPNDLVNTPISYVDYNGQIEHIYIKLCDNEQLTSIYDYYQDTHGGSSWNGSLYNYSCFIPSDIYEGLGSSDYTMLISEPYYNKDAIEVPVFEYGCQIEDSNEVLIGDNILTQHENCIYFYHYIYADNLTQDTAIDTTTIGQLSNPVRYRVYSSAKIEYESIDTDLKVLKVKLYAYTTYNRETDTWSDYAQINIPEDKDLAIFRHSYNLVTGEELVELMFIAKKVPPSVISENGKTLTLTLNHYKLN